MAFRSGFAVKQDFPLLDWALEDGVGNPRAVAVNLPQWARRGALLEVDTDSRRVRLQIACGLYLAGDLTSFIEYGIVDLNDYATARVAEIVKEQDSELVLDAAPSWIAGEQLFCWARNIPWQLLAADFAPGDWFRSVRLTETYLFLVSAKKVGAVAAGRAALATNEPAVTIEWIIPVTDINLTDLRFDYAAGELQQRQALRADRELRPLMSIPETLGLLADVPVIADHLPQEYTTTIELADNDGEFEAATPTNIRTSGLALADINAFTDSSSAPTKILLRPGAQGAGTEVHEMLHALAAHSYSRYSWLFFNEGVTEYFTRKATAGRFDRKTKYSAEYDFIERLVKMGATDDATLASLYFAGNWAGFEKTLRTFAGSLLSLPVLRKLNSTNSLAMCQYLQELQQNSEAPLGREDALTF
jgi:hypothetical protein